MNLQDKIIALIHEIAATTDCTVTDSFTGDTVLLDSGLDSLGFAILVARLEEELGFDPFAQSDEAIYPKTLGEFVTMYQAGARENG